MPCGVQSGSFIFLQVPPQDPVKPVRCLPQVPGVIGGKSIIRPDIRFAADIIQHLIQAIPACAVDIMPHPRVFLDKSLPQLPSPVVVDQNQQVQIRLWIIPFRSGIGFP